MSLPVDLNTITVTGSFPNIAGQPQSGSVVFDPGGQVTDTVGLVVMSGAVTAQVHNGVMAPVTLPCTDNGSLNPSGFTYLVTATIGGTKYASFSVLLPHTLGAAVDLAVLVPVSSDPGTSTVYGVLALPNTWTAANTFAAETVVPTPVNGGDAATKAYVDGHSGAVSSVFTRAGAVVAAAGDYTVGQVTGAAPLASPALTGSPTAPTQTPGDNTTKVATDAFVTAAVGVETTRAQTAEGLALAKASNLSDVAARQTALNTLAGAVTSAQYLRGDGTNVSMSAVQAADLPTATTSVKGAVRIDGTDADITAAPGTGSAGSSGIVADAKHVHPSPTVFAPTGLTGATAASRYAGATASGAPASGTFALGDIVIDQAGSLRICTAAGSPGSWGKLAQLTGNAGSIQPSPGTAAAGSVSVGADAGHVHGQPPMFAPTGLTGATAASRYVGAVASGSPASGTFVVGDFSVDQAGAMWVCTVGGSPGTWVKLPHRDSNPADIQPLGTQAAGATGTAADAGHVHPTTGLMTMVATTGVTGYTMVNGTGNIVTWTAPSDGAMHRVMMFAEINVTSTETGGQVTNTLTFPDGVTASSKQVFAAAHAAGTDFPLSASCPQFYLIGPGTTFTVKQNSALTSGAAVVYAELWAS